MRNVKKKDINKVIDIYEQITELLSPSLSLGTEIINQSSNILLLETASEGYGYGANKIIKDSLGNIDLILELNNDKLTIPGIGLIPGEGEDDQNLGDPVPYDPIVGPTEKPISEELENNKCFLNRLKFSSGTNYEFLKGVGGHIVFYEHGDYVRANTGFCLGKYDAEGNFDPFTNEEARLVQEENEQSFSSGQGNRGWLRRTFPKFPDGQNSTTWWDYIPANYLQEALANQNNYSYPSDEYNSNAISNYYLDYSSRSFSFLLGADSCPTGYLEIPGGMVWPAYLVEVRNANNTSSKIRFNRQINYCSNDTPIEIKGPSTPNIKLPKKCKCKKGKRKMNCGCSCREISDIMAHYLSRINKSHDGTREKVTNDVQKLGEFLQKQIIQTAPTLQDVQPDLSPILQKLEDLKRDIQNGKCDLEPILQRLNEVEAFLWTGIK